MPYIKSEHEDIVKYEYVNGDICYYKKYTFILHNPYGPAIIYKDGTKFYFIEDKSHRLDGPAKIYLDGTEQYYIDDKELTKEQFETHPERLKYLGKEYLICLT